MSEKTGASHNTQNMTNADIFIDKYKQLEEVVRSTYHLNENDSISFYLSGQAKYQRYRDDIKYCQDVRNLLSHKKKLNNNFAVEPSQQMIDFIDNLINRIKSRKKCSEIRIKKSDVYWQDMSGNVKSAMAVMRKNLFTHIPIMNDGMVVGVFDENSIFNYLSDKEIIEIDDNLKFENIAPYLSLNEREMEQFLFFRLDGYVEELEHEIEKNFRSGKRVGVVFLTQNGNPREQLEGIITPWDIIAASK